MEATWSSISSSTVQCFIDRDDISPIVVSLIIARPLLQMQIENLLENMAKDKMNECNLQKRSHHHLQTTKAWSIVISFQQKLLGERHQDARVSPQKNPQMTVLIRVPVAQSKQRAQSNLWTGTIVIDGIQWRVEYVLTFRLKPWKQLLLLLLFHINTNNYVFIKKFIIQEDNSLTTTKNYSTLISTKMLMTDEGDAKMKRTRMKHRCPWMQG